jgi:hypothetical protein
MPGGVEVVMREDLRLAAAVTVPQLPAAPEVTEAVHVACSTAQHIRVQLAAVCTQIRQSNGTMLVNMTGGGRCGLCPLLSLVSQALTAQTRTAATPTTLVPVLDPNRSQVTKCTKTT